MITFLKGLCLTSASILLLSLTWLAVETIKSERAIAISAAAVPGIVEGRLASIQEQTLSLVDTHMTRIEGTVNRAVKTADNRLAGIQEVAAEQLRAATSSIATVAGVAASTLPNVTNSVSQSLSGIAADVHQVAVPIAGTAAQINEAAPLYLDCEFNPDCAFNRFQGTSKAVEKSAQAIAKAAPQMAEDAAKIEGHVASISASADLVVTELTRPRKWWQHLEDWGKFGLMAGARFF